MNNKVVIEKTATYVRNEMNKEPGHDWWHICRVWNISRHIAKDEKADTFIVEMAVLLHDLDDWKFSKNYNKTKKFLKSVGIDKKYSEQIMHIINNISFRGEKYNYEKLSIEGQVVQDADRLDAMGAIGIARCFSFAGFRNNVLHDPSAKPRRNMKFHQYRKNESSAINHFYEKLFLLKGLMNTKTAKKMAGKRHKFMKEYLDMFLKEWNGEI